MSTLATLPELHDEPPVVPPGSALAPGYLVVDHLSRGQALDVYEVWSEQRMCHCVAKTIRPDRAHTARVRDRLVCEGELLRRLSHPHLVRAFETTFDDAGTPVVVLELVPGPTLEQVVATRTRRLPAADLAHLGRQLCAGLHHLHAAGYLHLDVRPANVVARDGVAVLIDLSIARRPGAVPRGLGSREYLAPEQARGGVVGAATDVWGLGATLFESATGVAPFAPHDDAEREAGFAQLHRAAPSPASLGRRLPGGLTDLLDAMLAPDPAERPALVEVHDRLGALVA